MPISAPISGDNLSLFIYPAISFYARWLRAASAKERRWQMRDDGRTLLHALFLAQRATPRARRYLPATPRAASAMSATEERRRRRRALVMRLRAGADIAARRQFSYFFSSPKGLMA